MNLLRKQRGLWARFLLVLITLLTSVTASAQGTGVIVGTVIDASTKKPLADVVVTATSPSLQGEQTVVTDSSGSYRIPNLPPGVYNLNLDKDGFKPFGRGGVAMTSVSTIRVNIDLIPESVRAEEIVVVGKAPIVDVGSSSTSLTVNQDFTSRIALNGGSAIRSFEDLATVAPGAHSDAYGVSINGTTSPENSYVIDGVSVNDPAFGINGSPLSQEFVKEVNVISGGYMPEYGRATGGILDVVTQSGSNEFHGSVFFSITPGALEGTRKIVKRDGTTIQTDPSLSSLRDFGATVGGPILKDKIWFFAGLDFAFETNKLTRRLNQLQICDAAAAAASKGQPNECKEGDYVREFDNDLGQSFTKATPIDGTERVYYETRRSAQYIGKLTFLLNPDNRITLSVSGTPQSLGGDGTFIPGQGNLIGPASAFASKGSAWANDVSLKYQSEFDNKRWLLDATLGWHHQLSNTLPSDGSGIGNKDGQSGTPEVIFRRTANPVGDSTYRDVHSLTDFESVPAGACAPGTVTLPDPNDPTGMATVTKPKTTCPVTQYIAGGPGFIEKQLLDRYQGRAIITRLLQGAGHHVIKAGADIAYQSFDHTKAYTGGDLYRESTRGTNYADFRQFAVMTGPDKATQLASYKAGSHSTEVGGFIQDSWSILDKVTLNAGLRYDSQVIVGADNQTGLSLPTEISPRIGVVYDFTQAGRSKLYANFAQFYESVPLDMADRSFPGEPQASSFHSSKVCDPTGKDPTKNHCQDGTGLLTVGDVWAPNQKWLVTGGDKVPVDPNIKPQSSNELVVGGEYQIIEDGVLGLRYTRRWMNNIIEDMSRDEANSYFIGNPGSGIAKDFPKAVRDYDAVTVNFTKAFSHEWLAQASYTASYLRGNWAGLFRPETAQLDPNINSDFDLRSLLANRTGPLPGDRTHQIQIYGAKDFILPHDMDITVGLTFRGRSGEPQTALGSHPIYGSDEVYILPRGAEDRLPWVFNIDPHLAFGMRLAKDAHLQVSMDIFNIFNFQAVTSRDQSFATGDVLPIDGGTKADLDGCKPGAPAGSTCKLRAADGSPFNPNDTNPNYGNPTSYQTPRQFRFGARITF